ncbi:MAG TPA: hypothetical protein P5329_06075, partial [Candidatus Competibacteraceae bacterium]|nr:hypothetical protein [Candidatus Competibacteraceae bacterium]
MAKDCNRAATTAKTRANPSRNNSNNGGDRTRVCHNGAVAHAANRQEAWGATTRAYPRRRGVGRVARPVSHRRGVG